MTRRSRSLLILVFTALFAGVACMVVFDSYFGNSAPDFVSSAFAQQPSLKAQSAIVAANQKGGMEPQPFAFIELFTSEGCSSCPSADKNLERITAQAKSLGQNVYTLSYHVDYWDYLGWKDPYSAEQFSDRQRGYAKQFQSDRVYTPQMVVNGLVEFVGSNVKLSNKAVNLALQSKTESAISVNPILQDGLVKAHWKAQGRGNGDRIQVALVQNYGTQKVSRGENARRQLTHANIVRQLETVTAQTDEGNVEFSLPDGLAADKFHVVAFIQSPDLVTAAAKSLIVTESAVPTNDQIKVGGF